MASVLCSWGSSAGSGRWDVLREWVADSGCDACAISFGPEDVVEYAARWTGLSAGALGARAQAEAIARWLRFYAEAGIEAIWFGVLVLRRRSGVANWFAGLDATRPPSPARWPAARAHLRGAGRARRPARGRAARRRARPRGAPPARAYPRLGGAGYELADIRLMLEDDIGSTGRSIRSRSTCCSRSTAARSARSSSAVAAERGLDEAQLAAESLPSLRWLYGRGFLVSLVSRSPRVP